MPTDSANIAPKLTWGDLDCLRKQEGQLKVVPDTTARHISEDPSEQCGSDGVYASGVARAHNTEDDSAYTCSLAEIATHGQVEPKFEEKTRH